MSYNRTLKKLVIVEAQLNHNHETIAQVLPPNALKKGHIVFKLLKTQKQASCVCGYFALAFATALCFGLDPETLNYDQDKLIQHYIDCVFNNKQELLFPYNSKKVYNTTNQYTKYKLP